MVTLLDLQEPLRTIALPAPGGELSITYRLERFSVAEMLKWQRLMQEEQEGPEQLMLLVRRIADLIADWNLSGPVPSDGSIVPEGEPVPVDPEVIAHIPLHVMRWIIETISQDANRPNLMSAGRSRPG
ncbi:MAG: hypothetical protein N2439_04495 [Anaerolineae bacterium]|nr:hypothetical protein [Anaerolineae bacterium]